MEGDNPSTVGAANECRSVTPVRPRSAPEKMLLKTLPADAFVAQLALYNGPVVSVTVREGDKERIFRLPKALVSYHSAYFKGAFNGPFKEAVDSQLCLGSEVGISVGTFELVVQWMYAGQIVLQDLKDSRSGKITQLLEFMIAADYLDLLGPFDSVLYQMKMVLRSDYLALEPYHVRKAAKLPNTNPVRKLFAEASLQAWLYHTQKPRKPRCRKFKFEKELEEEDAFAADLLRAVGASWKHRQVLDTGGISIRDPITNKNFIYF